MGSQASLSDLDVALHNSRLNSDGSKRTFEADASTLPDQTIVVPQGQIGVLILRKDHAYAWNANGYATRFDRPTGVVRVLTPELTVNILRNGFESGPIDPVLAW